MVAHVQTSYSGSCREQPLRVAALGVSERQFRSSKDKAFVRSGGEDVSRHVVFDSNIHHCLRQLVPLLHSLSPISNL